MADSFYKRLIEILKKHGFVFCREAAGSHEIWWHPETRRRITLPKTTKSRHTANKILQQAGIDHKFS